MQDRHLVKIDQCHIDLIAGLVKSLKPERILELGFGTGETTQAVLSAIKFNGIGHLTVVDNWSLFNGSIPDHPILDDARVSVHTGSERDFVAKAETGRYELVISDADHWAAHEWLGEYLRICRPGGLIVMHDTASPHYPRLRDMIAICEKRGLPYFEFNKSSRPDEECWRGTLVVGVRS